MARRASSGLNPGIILAVVLVAGVVVYGGKQLLGSRDKGISGQALDMEELLENGNALRTNVYVVEGEIDEKLQITDSGQLVSVKVSGPGGDEYIGIEIPAEFNDRNIETKQKYAFKVEFQKGGIAVATEIQRL